MNKYIRLRSWWKLLRSSLSNRKTSPPCTHPLLASMRSTPALTCLCNERCKYNCEETHSYQLASRGILDIPKNCCFFTPEDERKGVTVAALELCWGRCVCFPYFYHKIKIHWMWNMWVECWSMNLCMAMAQAAQYLSASGICPICWVFPLVSEHPYYRYLCMMRVNTIF